MDYDAGRLLRAYRRHREKCTKPKLRGVDPFGVVYRCETCRERIHGARYLVSGMSVVSSGHTGSGRLRQGVEVLDTFTGVWYVTDENGSIPHDNRCMHCGQDMSCVDPETAAQVFDPKSDAG